MHIDEAQSARDRNRSHVNVNVSRTCQSSLQCEQLARRLADGGECLLCLRANQHVIVGRGEADDGNRCVAQHCGQLGRADHIARRLHR